MKLPNKRTPVRRCLAAAGYSSRMMAKHADDPRLVELGGRFDAGRAELAQSQRQLEDAEENLALVRVEVEYEDYVSDRFLRRLLARAEGVDGRKGGKLSQALFPDGLTDITRRQGAVQVEKMRALEARLAAIQDWADAPALNTELIARRTSYEGAVTLRLEAERQVVTARANRNAAKERFLDLYAEIANQIRAIFPRDRRKQDLFFDQLSASPRRYDEEPDDDLPDEPDDAAGAV